jgi:hypothetical protein
METFFALLIVGFAIYIISKSKNKPNVKTSAVAQNKAVAANRQSPEQTAKEMTELLMKSITIQVGGQTKTISDPDIIDVSGNAYQIPTATGENVPVPYWPHFYVYSYNDLERATTEQRNFYGYFKKAFLQKQYINLQGNNNYAFVLLFDLLNEFGRNVKELELHLKPLAEHYTRTLPYCRSFLIEKLRESGNYDEISRINHEFSYQPSSYDYDYTFYRLGDKYKTQLGLTDQQLVLVNKLWNPGNNFSSIEFCLVQTIKLYLLLVEELDSIFGKEQSSLEEEIKKLAGLITVKHFKYKEGSYNYKYSVESVSDELFRLLFKHCENSLREYYGHKRKINTDVYYPQQVRAELQERLLSKLDTVFPFLLTKLPLPDEATEIVLNAQNTTRWKLAFEKIKLQHPDNREKKFCEAVIGLGTLNKSNPSIENIFYEASKFIAKADRHAALEMYIHYLYHDLRSETFDNRQFTKTIQKSLFKNNEELQQFEKLVSDLIKDKNLEKALEEVSQVYLPKRKKIKLDATLISEVKEKHSATVDLLDEILKDEYEDDTARIKTEQVSDDEVKIEIQQKTAVVAEVIIEDRSGLNPVQRDVLELFFKNSFALSFEDMDSFARSRSAFKNQLIESINDVCFERLDDLLIEEEDDNYVMNPNYYQTIITQ